MYSLFSLKRQLFFACFKGLGIPVMTKKVIYAKKFQSAEEARDYLRVHKAKQPWAVRRVWLDDQDILRKQL